jgi:hypothetical protein
LDEVDRRPPALIAWRCAQPVINDRYASGLWKSGLFAHFRSKEHPRPSFSTRWLKLKVALS